MKERIVHGISMILAATVLGAFVYESRTSDNTVRVVGAATTRLNADVVKWRMMVSRSVAEESLESGYAHISKDVQLLLAELNAHGIQQTEINVQPTNAHPVYGQYKGITGYTVQQPVFITSSDVDRVEKLALNPVGVLSKGVVLQSTRLEYYSSKLSDMKRELLA